jgi:hypothetical protein
MITKPSNLLKLKMYISAKKSCHMALNQFKNARALPSSISVLSKQTFNTQMMACTPSMNFFSLNKMAKVQINESPLSKRFFSSLPPHTKIEMPNLSPTMEKVNI